MPTRPSHGVTYAVMEATSSHQLDTHLVHAGEPTPRTEGSVVAPIFQSATFVHHGGEDELRYGRYNNTPTHELLHAKLAALEGAEAGLVTASGMAAIASTLLSLLKAGDHVLVQDELYGGTHALVHHEFPRLGIAVDAVPSNDPEAWHAARRPNTRVFHFESLSNPLLTVPNLEALAAFAREHGIVTTIDNTFASPVNLRPHEHGIDVVLHSATKYLNGHSDLCAGAVTGSAARVSEVDRVARLHGGTLDPHACFLLNRGMKTLGVRVRRQNETALTIARELEAHPRVRTVHHPGLASHPDHERALQLFDGLGGMLSFVPEGDVASVEHFLSHLELFQVAPSLGGVESLATLPARTSHAALSPEERKRAGIPDTLVRLSIGVEDPGDLLEDLHRALE